MRRQSTGFILRAFAIIALTFVLTFFVLLYIARPVVSSDGVLTHMHVDFIQDMLSASMNGMSDKQARAYIEKLSDPIFVDARLVPLEKGVFQSLAANTGLYLTPSDLRNLERGEALIAELHPKGDAARHSVMRHKKNKKRIHVPGASEPMDDKHPSSIFSASFFKFWLWFPQKDGVQAYDSLNDLGQPGTEDFLPPYGMDDFRDIGRLKEDAAWQGNAGQMTANLVDHKNDALQRDKVSKQEYEKKNRVHYLLIPLKSCGQLLYVRYEQPVGLLIPTTVMIFGTIVVLLIMLAAAFGLILPTILRVQKYELVCEHVARGNYAVRCNDKRNDTLGLLGRHIDEMTDAIQSHMDRQKLLLQAVAHEMRTPLARVRFSLEMLDIPEDDDMRNARLKSIEEDLEEVDALIKELNYFNYVDAGNGRQYFEENDVGEMIRGAIKKCSPALGKFQLSIEGLDKEELTITVDAQSFRHVIINLLENARRYAKEKIAIVVQKSDDEKYMDISVEDDGPGIPVESRKFVLEPFASVDKSRNKAHSGFGLGLAIVDRTIKMHGGLFSIEDSELGGCRMLTRWPIHQADA